MFKDLERSETIKLAFKDASVSAELVQAHREDMETLDEEGIDSYQQGHTPYLEYLLLQSLNKKRALADHITVIEATTEKIIQATKRRILNDFVLKEILNSTEKSAEGQGEIPEKFNNKVVAIRNLSLLDNEVHMDVKETSKISARA